MHRPPEPAREDMLILQARLDEAEDQLREATTTITTLREQLASTAARCADQVDGLPRERDKLVKQLAETSALNASLVEDLLIVAKRCAATLELQPGGRKDPSKAMREALVLLQVFAETTAEAGTRELQAEALARTLEITIPMSDQTPAILARVYVLRRDERVKPVSVDEAVTVWDGFRDRLDQLVEETLAHDKDP